MSFSQYNLKMERRANLKQVKNAPNKIFHSQIYLDSDRRYTESTVSGLGLLSLEQ